MSAVKKILVIDDETAIRESFSDFLEDLGYLVVTAENGKKGVEEYYSNKFDLVMVDLRMPEMNGLQVLNKISESNPETPLIVISGTGMITDAIQALNSGAWDYLLKPVEDLEILAHAVEKALERARLRKENIEYHQDLENKVEMRTMELKKKTESLKKEIILREKAEQKLKKLLKEKETLLQEIHHRVKNNMSVVISLLNLKSSMLDNAEAKNILLDCENRIKSMALVHEKLYHNSNNLIRINVKEYITALIDGLMKSLDMTESQIGISYKIDPIFFELSPLIYLGLILNEIITNSIKHAFSGISDPIISVTLRQINEKEIELNISDNGNGFSNTPSSGDNPIGLDIINLLVEQMDGTIQISTEDGTGFHIVFPFK